MVLEKIVIKKKKYHIKEIMLNQIEKHIVGKWRVYRFIAAFAMVTTIGVLSYTDLSRILANLLKVSSPDFLVSLLIFLYVLSIELWIWFMRFKVYSVVNELDTICNNCSFAPKS